MCPTPSSPPRAAASAPAPAADAPARQQADGKSGFAEILDVLTGDAPTASADTPPRATETPAPSSDSASQTALPAAMAACAAGVPAAALVTPPVSADGATTGPVVSPETSRTVDAASTMTGEPNAARLPAFPSDLLTASQAAAGEGALAEQALSELRIDSVAYQRARSREKTAGDWFGLPDARLVSEARVDISAMPMADAVGGSPAKTLFPLSPGESGMPTGPVNPVSLSAVPSPDALLAASTADAPQAARPAVPGGPAGPARATGSAPALLAAGKVAANLTDTAPADDRLAAMMRMTTTSSESQAGARSVSNQTASGEGHAAAHRERHPSPEADMPLPASRAAEDSFPAPKHAAGVTAPEGSGAATAASSRTEAAPLSLHDRVRVVDQVAQRLEAMRLANGRHEVTLQLKPEHLGDLRLTIVADRDLVTAQILADTPLARQAVEEGREQLRAALEQKGFSLQGLDVALNQGGSDRRSLPFIPEASAVTPRAFRPAAPVDNLPVGLVASRTSALRNGRLDYRA